MCFIDYPNWKPACGNYMKTRALLVSIQSAGSTAATPSSRLPGTRRTRFRLRLRMPALPERIASCGQPGADRMPGPFPYKGRCNGNTDTGDSGAACAVRKCRPPITQTTTRPSRHMAGRQPRLQPSDQPIRDGWRAARMACRYLRIGQAPICSQPRFSPPAVNGAHLPQPPRTQVKPLAPRPV